MDKNFVCPKCHKGSYYYNYSWEFLPNKDLSGHIGNLNNDYGKRKVIICPYCLTKQLVPRGQLKNGTASLLEWEKIKENENA